MSDSDLPPNTRNPSFSLPDDRPLWTFAHAAARIAEKSAGSRFIVGARGSAPALLATEICRTGRPVVLVCGDAETARKAFHDASFAAREEQLLGDGRAGPVAAPRLYLAPEGDPYAEVHQDRRAAMGRTATLFQIAAGLPVGCLIVNAPALTRRVPPVEVMKHAGVALELGAELDTEVVARTLVAAGYLRAPVVEDPGSFALRGGLLDAWSPEAARPLRVEIDFDTISALKRFDPDSQRTVETLDEPSWLSPAREAIINPEREARARAILRSLCDAVDMPSTKTRQFVDDIAGGTTFYGAEAYLPAFYDLVPLLSYLPADSVVLFDSPQGVLAALRTDHEQAIEGELHRRDTPRFPADALVLDEHSLNLELQRHQEVSVAAGGTLGQADEGELDRIQIAPDDAPTLATGDQSELIRGIKSARQRGGSDSALSPLQSQLEAWRDEEVRVILAARVTTQANRMAQLLRHRGLEINVATESDQSDSADATIVVGELSRGLVAPLERLVLLTEEEIFGTRAHRKQPKARTARSMLEDLRALAPGDFVVHVDHGIGRYLGLEHRSVGSVQVDLLVVEYAGSDRFFLPVYRLNQIQKYSGGEGNPKVDRLGGQSFAKTKAKVKKKVRQMADKLLELYAERNAATRPPLEELDDEYSAFEATFPFEETPDQAAAIADVHSDLSEPRVMDRLICGDVGFGKTEVALRAAFRMAMEGRQVALLCPTTVLAQQHFRTFEARFREYPIRIGLMSRFVPKKTQSEVVAGLKSGQVDIVIGTHRLLSKDVHFSNLGLLIVDEEQRFGVTHKERIKNLRTSVDVLTLSATPIPRTLQLAIGGLRDMSIISTAPVDRRAIRTLTSRYDDDVVREAIERELRRGGQVFYVYNRVEGLYERAARIQSLVPKARVAVGHGQMSEGALEKAMLSFVEGDTDILCSTAIIESGLDIPRANTMIVDRADLFGLSQLYQLRGRVGRSAERAYCYLLVPPASKMSDEARERIEALERYTDLGSGFHIASLDMEQRGAGDLLGGDQSGFVASVGFDIFCQMLEDATAELRGEQVVHEVDPDLNVDVEALLPDTYIDEVGVRLSLYKRLASASTGSEVQELGMEMEDRFGRAPMEAQKLVELMRLKTELRDLRVLGLEASQKSVTLHLREDTPLDPLKITQLVARTGTAYKLSPDMRLTRRAGAGEQMVDGLAFADQMLSELAECLKDPAS